MRRLAAALLLALVTALASAAAASAEIVTSRDNAGRTITFDVLTPGVDVEWFAGILRDAAHGDEITSLTIRVVAREDIRFYCGSGAVACYSERPAPRITVPAGADDGLRATVLHEYGHHLDTAWAVSGHPELNGTPAWWAARGMTALLDSGSVAFGYELGWSRSIAEIFAEDYAYVHLGGFYSIPWLAPPDEALRTALLTELNGTPPATPAPLPPAAPPATQPVEVNRSGSVAAGRRQVLPFRLLGPGRRVTFTATLTPAARRAASGRLEIVCGGTVVAGKAVTSRRATALDVPGLGPAACEAALVSTSRSAQRYSMRLRLAIEA